MTMPDTVTLPRDAYERALAALPRDLAAALVAAAEDAEDLADMDAAAASGDPYLPDDLVERLIAGEHPLRVWRAFRGLTLQALADRAGVGKSHIGHIENRRRDGTVETFRKLAAALDCTVDDLIP